MWTKDDIVITVKDDLSEDNVITAMIDTPDGKVWVMGEVTFEGSRLEIRGLHIHGDDVGANEYGVKRLRWLANAIMELVDCDEIIVEGATRASGAAKGNLSRPVRFPRKVSA